MSQTGAVPSRHELIATPAVLALGSFALSIFISTALFGCVDWRPVSVAQFQRARSNIVIRLPFARCQTILLSGWTITWNTVPLQIKAGIRALRLYFNGASLCLLSQWPFWGEHLHCLHSGRGSWSRLASDPHSFGMSTSIHMQALSSHRDSCRWRISAKSNNSHLEYGVLRGYPG